MGDARPANETGGHRRKTAALASAFVFWMAIDLERPSVLFAGTDQAGIYRSVDGEATWEPSLPRAGGWVGGLVSSPHGVFAATSHFTIHRSTDHGVTWREIEVAPERRITQLVYGTYGDVLLAGSEWGCLYASRDGGATWSNTTGNLPHYPLTATAVSGPLTYWAGVGERGERGLYRTDDAGATWTASSLDIPQDAGVRRILVAKDDPDLILVGLHNVHNEGRPEGVCYSWITRNGGNTWSSVWGGFDPDNGFWPLAQGPGGALYVNNANRIYVSHDRGHTWTRLRLVEGLAERRPGDIGDLDVHPIDPGTLYVPVLNGVAASHDGGLTWRVENEGMILTRVSLLAADPDVLYAASANGEGTFRSEDRGGSWTWLNGGGLMHPWADELVIHPTDPSTIYEIVDVADVFASTDSGRTWQEVWDTSQFSSIVALAAAPSDPDVLYACKNGFGLYRSNDGGRRWRFLHQSGVDYTYTIAIHPHDPTVVFSGTNPKPFQDCAMIRRSADAGATWETVLRVEGSDGITSIVFDPSNPKTLYAGSIGAQGGRLFVSHDGGDTWRGLNDTFTMCTVWGQPQLVIHPEAPHTAYIGTWLGGTWKTSDAGATWRLLEGAPVSATSVALDPRHPETVYLGDRSSPTVWISTDAGATWREAADFRADGALLVMRVVVHDRVAFASTFHPGLRGGRLYRSLDAGMTWEDVTGVLPKGILDICIDARDPQRVYVTTNINGAYRSGDGGATWSHIDGFPDAGAYDIEIHPRDPSTLYASVRGGSLPSWFTEMSGDHPDGVTFSDPAGVCRSTDGGETWSWSENNVGPADVVPTSCAVGGSTVYVGTQGCGIWSGDLDPGTGTITWSTERSNKPTPAVHSLEIQLQPGNPEGIYVSSYPGGLTRSTDGGRLWRDRNGINPSVVVDDPLRQGYYTFAIVPSDSDEMWLGTWGKGIYVSHDAMLLNVPTFGDDRAMLGTYIYRIVLDPRDPSQVYVASEEGVFHTADAGVTWTRLDAGLPTTQVRALVFTANGHLVAGTLGYGVYEYLQAARRWTALGELSEFQTFWPMWSGRPLYQYSTLLIDPTDPETMYCGTFPAGVYKTTDGGAHWRETNVGWTNDGVFCLAFHPRDTGILYSGTYNGVNRSLDGGAHWQT